MTTESEEVRVSDEDDADDDGSFDWGQLGNAVYMVLMGLTILIVLGHGYIVEIIHAVQGR